MKAMEPTSAPRIAGRRRSAQCLMENRYMDKSQQSDFELLVKILD